MKISAVKTCKRTARPFGANRASCELVRVIRDGPAPEANKREFFHELMDWMCKKTMIGSNGAKRFVDYDRLREHVMRWNPALLSNSPLEEPIDMAIVRWWVRVSLDTDHDTEAQQAEDLLTDYVSRLRPVLSAIMKKKVARTKPSRGLNRSSTIFRRLNKRRQTHTWCHFSMTA